MTKKIALFKDNEIDEKKLDSKLLLSELIYERFTFNFIIIKKLLLALYPFNKLSLSKRNWKRSIRIS